MGGDQNTLAAQNGRENFLDVIRQHTGSSIFEAFAPRRRHVIRTPPDVHLLGAPFRSRIILVEPGQITVVALVERLVAENRNVGLSHLLENKIKRALRPDQRRSEAYVEEETLRLELAAGGACLRDAVLGEVDVLPAGEEIPEIPLALAMTHQHENPLDHYPGLRTSINHHASRARPPSNRVPASARAPTAPRGSRRGRRS